MRCSSCNHENRPDSKFCDRCGQPCGRPVAAPPVIRSATPKHLADKILGSRAALEGERKQVTVLFADVKGSMDLAERLDPGEWSQIMRRSASVQAERLAKDTSP